MTNSISTVGGAAPFRGAQGGQDATRDAPAPTVGQLKEIALSPAREELR